MSNKIQECKLLIIGGGPAGYAAAIYAARASLKPLQVLGYQPGGQLTITTDVENYPGFPEGILGPVLMQQIQKQAERFGTEMVSSTIINKVDFSSSPFACVADNGITYRAESVIIATGAEARWLGIPSEEQYRGYGVSSCATCDGFFFRNKKVLVVGGGNTALEESLFLSKFVSEVTIVHRRDAFKAEKILQERLFNSPKIKVKWNCVLEEVLGEKEPLKVTGARLRNVQNGLLEDMEVSGIFIAIGHIPLTKPFLGQLKTDGEGYIVTVPGTTRTSVPGVFAAGDVQDKIYRQAITAAGQGCMAALEAERYLEG